MPFLKCFREYCKQAPRAAEWAEMTRVLYRGAQGESEGEAEGEQLISNADVFFSPHPLEASARSRARSDIALERLNAKYEARLRRDDRERSLGLGNDGDDDDDDGTQGSPVDAQQESSSSLSPAQHDGENTWSTASTGGDTHHEAGELIEPMQPPEFEIGAIGYRPDEVQSAPAPADPPPDYGADTLILESGAAMEAD